MRVRSLAGAATGLSPRGWFRRRSGQTAGTVTSAAIVMVAVFAIFATLRSIDMKQMGVGLAVAVLLDATIVRAALLPSAMKLLGESNWYLPRWLEWLPSLSTERAPAEKAPEAPPIPAGN